MYGKRLIPKLEYGIHPTTSNQSPQGPVVGFELTPPQPEKYHEAGTYHGTVKYQKGYRGSMKTLSRACNKYAYLGSRPHFEGFRADPR